MSGYMRHSAPAPFAGRLLGRIEGCTNPESAELLPDGEHFVFGNCTLVVGVPEYRGGQGIVYEKDKAFVSLGHITTEGAVSLKAREHLAGLTATLGIDILSRATGLFPVGAAFNVQGGNPVIHRGHLLDPDLEAKPCVCVFDPISGAVLGRVGLDRESPIGKKFNRIDQPNGCAIDAAGNLYFGDIPNGNPDPEGPPPVPSAIYKIRHGAIDALTKNEDAAALSVERILCPGFINGLTASPLDASIFAVSCSFHDPVNGGIYQLHDGDFRAGRLPEPLVRGLGILDGVGVTRRGTLLASTPITGEVHAFTVGGAHYTVKVDGKNPVRMPADFNVCYPKAAKGEPCLLITDISVGSPPGDASVAVLEIKGL